MRWRAAAALASIELFETQNYMEKDQKGSEAVTRREMKGFTDPRIREVRIMGGCVCVEVYDPAVLKGYQEYACKRGVFSRPFLNYLYAMVPYVIQENGAGAGASVYEGLVCEIGMRTVNTVQNKHRFVLYFFSLNAILDR